LKTLFLTLLVAIFLFSIPAKADTVYTYTGLNFITGCTTCSITGSFAVAAPLAPDLNGTTCGPGIPAVPVCIPVIPDSFSFTDNGGITITSSTAAFDYFYVNTDDDGNITNWNIFMSLSPVGETSLATFRFFEALGDQSNDGSIPSPGTWSVPEPSSMLLLATGLLALVGLGLRRNPQTASDSVLS
jgi:hypothetical protein